MSGKSGRAKGKRGKAIRSEDCSSGAAPMATAQSVQESLDRLQVQVVEAGRQLDVMRAALALHTAPEVLQAIARDAIRRARP